VGCSLRSPRMMVIMSLVCAIPGMGLSSVELIQLKMVRLAVIARASVPREYGESHIPAQLAHGETQVVRCVLEQHDSSLRFCFELLQLVFRNDFSVEQMHFALGMAGKARIVRDHADRRSLAMQIGEQMHHRFAVLRVQVARGLVGQQDRGRTGQCARHSHALLLTAGELRG